MTIFEYVAAVFALIVGLGVTRLLGSAVEVFRRRRESPLSVKPLVWAALIFVTQMQFMWGGFELSQILTGWTRGMFLLILVLALLLFVAGALVFPGAGPRGGSLQEEFDAHGRWALACLAAYFLVAFLLNPVFFGVEIWSRINLLALLCSVGPVAYLVLPGGRFGVWSRSVAPSSFSTPCGSSLRPCTSSRESAGSTGQHQAQWLA
jgi:hypothetical protein